MKKNYKEQMIPKEWIVNAVIELTKEKHYEDITITELSKKAGIPRSTFYNYYSSKDEILEDFIEYIKNLIACKLRNDETCDVITVSFQVMEQYREFNEMLIRCKKEYILQHSFLDCVYETSSDRDECIWMIYQSGGLYISMIEWIKRGCQPSATEMSKLINTLFSQEIKLVGTEVFKNRHTNLENFD